MGGLRGCSGTKNGGICDQTKVIILITGWRYHFDVDIVDIVDVVDVVPSRHINSCGEGMAPGGEVTTVTSNMKL